MKKTHANDTIIALLRSLPRAARLERNEQIKLRNQERQIGRAYRESDPLRNYDGERYSSDESLCTITDDDEGKPPVSSTAPSKPLSSLWLMRLQKRKQDDDLNDNVVNSALQRARKRHANGKAEVNPSESILLPGFNDTLPTNKVYLKEKVHVLDVQKFESEHGSEEDLTYLQWVQASENYIRFFESCGESGVAQATRWKNHFDFLRRRVDTIEDFPAVRALDIRFRKDYVPKPFAFSIALYNWELEKTIQSIQFQNLKARAENVRRNKFNRPKC
ncbi:hypothetical protein F5887DRAFT_977732 [Amanita rubescens]|nr:hypothetical protein F5887DRAFT_977732 [Amanita rubescens]